MTIQQSLSTHGESVLLVGGEGNSVSSPVVDVLLRRVKVRTATQHSCRELLVRCNFALVIVESLASRQQTLELCAAIRKLSRQPILLLTGDADEEYQLAAYDAGVNECVTMPDCAELILAKVLAWLRWSGCGHRSGVVDSANSQLDEAASLHLTSLILA